MESQPGYRGSYSISSYQLPLILTTVIMSMIKWSPIHPALFASVDGMGRLDLWNLNQDTDSITSGNFREGFIFTKLRKVS